MGDDKQCDKVAESLRGYLLKTLSAGRQREVEGHLAGCPSCREALTREEASLAVLHRALPDEAPRAGLADRTLASMGACGKRGRGFPLSSLEVATGLALLVVVVAILVPSFWSPREAARRASTQNKLKQLGLVFKMYSNESKDNRWPGYASAEGVWVPDISALFGTYVTDSAVLVSEEHPDAERLKVALAEELNTPNPDFEAAASVVGESFAYLGYTVTDVEGFDALRRARWAGLTPSEEDGVYPIREGVERFLITNLSYSNATRASAAQSSVPVIVDIAGWKHRMRGDVFEGASVLYQDGHVEFVPLGRFPVLPKVMDVLSGLAE